ncbi:hypothetical protein TNCV_965161 [Trichonephila clavipes]|nr:hypothetical protein TNCV_965161 [Trichonephila clavipes]
MFGSISMRKKLHPGVPPPTTESNKGGSVPVIWQNQARRLPGVHPEYSTTASGRGSNGKMKIGVQSSFCNIGLGSLREKKKRRNGMTRKRVENREGSLGYPGVMKPVFTKDSKPLSEKEKIPRAPRERETRTHLKKVHKGPLSQWSSQSRSKFACALIAIRQ